jgi:hypothetical protein
MSVVADIIFELSKENANEDLIHKKLSELPEKRIQYTFDGSVLARFSHPIIS